MGNGVRKMAIDARKCLILINEKESIQKDLQFSS